ncbi:MAG: 23S rRNA (uracil(1939)-C(5))-methyltransferase RlmD [Coriobacteriaceae bacterium]|nr:23S rRNA (uracil(1939)-C(5))-methyltransferase RlmD [Coriobacteriaceae bacterium]
MEKRKHNTKNQASRPQNCPYFKECGACSHVNMPYGRQLERKQEYIARLFEREISQGCVLEPILGMECPWGFRNKIVSPFAAEKRKPASRTAKSGSKGNASRRAPGRIRSERILHGMYARGSHRIIQLDRCPVEHESGRKVVKAVAQIMARYGVPAYDEDAGTGFMRHVLVRVGHNSGEVLVVLVTNGREFTGSKNFAKELVRRCPEITTIVQNVNTRQTNVILGEEDRVLYGPGFILDTLCGLSFRISPRSFYQVNARQTEALYLTAIDWALEDAQGARGAESIMDAYCGTGTIGLVAASRSKNACVVGVDKVEDAIRDARKNAVHNGIENAEFVAADAGAFLRERAAQGERFDVLLMDPPRAGSSEEFLRAVAESGVGRVAYISCNPETQARDARILDGLGYKAKRIRAVDMFPHTDHVENVMLFERA